MVLGDAVAVAALGPSIGRGFAVGTRLALEDRKEIEQRRPDEGGQG